MRDTQHNGGSSLPKLCFVVVVELKLNIVSSTGQRCNEKLRLVLLSKLTCPCEEKDLEHLANKKKRKKK